MSEICFNARQNNFGATWAEVFGNPFSRIAICFRVIAASLSPFAIMTSWDNVIWRVTTAFRYGNKVILRQAVPESARSTAVSAAVVKIFEGAPPISIGESAGEASLLGTTTLALISIFVEIVSPPLFVLFAKFVMVFKTVAPSIGAHSVWVIRLPTSRNGTPFIGRLPVIVVVGFAALIHILLFVLPIRLAHTLTASRSQPVTIARIYREFKSCGQLQRSAFGAMFKRGGDIKHSVFTSHSLPDVLSAGDGKDRFSRSYSLADKEYSIASKALGQYLASKVQQKG